MEDVYKERAGECRLSRRGRRETSPAILELRDRWAPWFADGRAEPPV